MTPRATIIAGLVVLELAIIGGIGASLRSGTQAFVAGGPAAAIPAGPDAVAEGGAHKIFSVGFGSHPSLTVDIGLADLTIATHQGPVDVAVSKSSDFGPIRETGPITARQVGNGVRIAINESRNIAIGDDRMVTVLVPPETRVTVVRAGDINVSGLRAPASIAAAGSGDVEIDDYAAPALRVVTRHGHITLRRVEATQLDLIAKSGHVDGSGMTVHDGNIESDERVTLGLEPASDTLVNVATDDGKILVSGFGGGESTGTGAGPRTVRIGNGQGRLAVHAGDGDINLFSES